MSDEAQASQDLHTPHTVDARGRRVQSSPKTPSLHSELQALRLKVEGHEETIGRLKAALGALSSALDTPSFNGHFETGFGNHEAANRPPRMDRRGANNNYRTNYRGGRGGRGAY